MNSLKKFPTAQGHAPRVTLTALKVLAWGNLEFTVCSSNEHLRLSPWPPFLRAFTGKGLLPEPFPCPFETHTSVFLKDLKPFLTMWSSGRTGPLSPSLLWEDRILTLIWLSANAGLMAYTATTHLWSFTSLILLNTTPPSHLQSFCR